MRAGGHRRGENDGRNQTLGREDTVLYHSHYGIKKRNRQAGSLGRSSPNCGHLNRTVPLLISGFYITTLLLSVIVEVAGEPPALQGCCKSTTIFRTGKIYFCQSDYFVYFCNRKPMRERFVERKRICVIPLTVNLDNSPFNYAGIMEVIACLYCIRMPIRYTSSGVYQVPYLHNKGKSRPYCQR